MNLNQLIQPHRDQYPQEKCVGMMEASSPSLLANLKQQREATASRLAKIDDAIAALEANPSVADLIQKLGAI